MNIGSLVNRRMGLVVVLSLVFGTTTAWGGSVTGTTSFKGDPQKRKVIKMAADVACVAANNGKPVGTKKVIVNKPNAKEVRTIRNVIVYIKSAPSGLTQTTPEASVTLDQKGCRYRPHVLTIQTGQTLIVLNSDATLHNIHGLPKKNAEFNFGQPRAGMKKTMTFKKTEIKNSRPVARRSSSAWSGKAWNTSLGWWAPPPIV